MFPLRCGDVRAEQELANVPTLHALRHESFRLPHDLHVAIEAIAAHERTSTSAIIRRAIAFEVERLRRTRRYAERRDTAVAS